MDPIDLSVDVYHYTTFQNYIDMHDEDVHGEKGLIPFRRFLPLDNSSHLPDKAIDSVVCALLEPEPKSWTRNEEFPDYWNLMLDDLQRSEDMVLLSFPLYPSDDAYVVDKAHRARVVYQSLDQFSNITDKDIKEANKNLWDSMVSLYDYSGDYSLPQVTIWSTIPSERLRVE